MGKASQTPILLVKSRSIKYSYYFKKMIRNFGMSMLLGTGVALVMMQSPVTAKSAEEVGEIARAITVKIETKTSDGRNPGGSGVILKREGDTYTVLTAAHVLPSGAQYSLTTPDGRKYLPVAGSVRFAPNDIDLAVLKFKSGNSYNTAKLGNSNKLKLSTEVQVGGFPALTRVITQSVFVITEGKVVANSSKEFVNGYSLLYGNPTLPGMSGGPVLNMDGEVVAIHGKGDRENNTEIKTGFNSGITISRFAELAQSFGSNLNGSVATVERNNTQTAEDFYASGVAKIRSQNLDGALADFNQAIRLNPNYIEAYRGRVFVIAKSVIIKVESSNGVGSGVVIGRQGDLYTIATTKHVAKALIQQSTFTLYTADGQVHQVPISGVKNLDGDLDLATFQFRSSRSYQVAQIANQNISRVDARVYTAGFAFQQGTVKSQSLFALGEGKVIAAVQKRLQGDKGGYTMMYNAPTLIGMSGGGVFDQNGRLVAIHGVGDRYQEKTEIPDRYIESAKAEEFSKIGYNRGIPAQWLLSSRGVKAQSTPTADEYFISGFNKFVDPGDDVLLGKRASIQYFSQAIKLNPRYALAYFMRAYLYIQVKEYDQALANYDQVIALNPRFANAFNNRGLIKDILRQPQDALRDFNQAISLNPKYAKAYYNRGILKYEQLNDPKGALTDFNQAITLKLNTVQGGQKNKKRLLDILPEDLQIFKDNIISLRGKSSDF
jgi:S1-C subfamily serine protease